MASSVLPSMSAAICTLGIMGGKIGGALLLATFLIASISSYCEAICGSVIGTSSSSIISGLFFLAFF